MQLPEQPPTQPPAWTQYDPGNTATPIHATIQQQTFWQRQMAVYRADIAKWARWLNLPVPAVVALMVVLVLCSCSFWGIAGLSALTNPSPSQAAAAAATKTASAPTVPLAPTATPLPTLPPTATPTTQQRNLQHYQRIVAGQTSNDTVTVSYDLSTNVISINDNIGQQLDEDGAVVVIKERAYDIMHAIYTDSSSYKPASVVLRILGPATDKYGNNIPDDQYARIVLTSDTAALFNWNGLTADSAWDVYDISFVAAYLQGHGA